MKTCTKCNQSKNLTEFHKRSSSKDGLQFACKECNSKSARKWQSENSERFEELWRKNSYGESSLMKRRASRYGLSVQQLLKMIEEADNKCKICGREPIKWLVVDHCHVTLKVRGLICERCNQGLGLFEDNIEALKNAIKYLEDK